MSLTANIGIAVSPMDAAGADELLQAAAVALARARTRGPGQFAFYDSAMNAGRRKRSALEVDLKRALEGNHLAVHYQPQVDLRSGRVVAAEALLRWRHSTEGWVPPGTILRMADELNLAEPLSQWSFRTICAQVRAWRDSTRGLWRVAVNFSGPEFLRALGDRLVQVTEEHGLSPHDFELEVTEQTLMSDVAAASRVLYVLRETGFRIAIDDFGTGYSSLAYLKDLPINTLKIDQAFVRDAPTDLKSGAIFETIGRLAKNLGLELVAEGVETEAQRSFLSNLDLTEATAGMRAQGFFFAAALPPEEFEEFASTHGRERDDPTTVTMGRR